MPESRMPAGPSDRHDLQSFYRDLCAGVGCVGQLHSGYESGLNPEGETFHPYAGSYLHPSKEESHEIENLAVKRGYRLESHCARLHSEAAESSHRPGNQGEGG